MEKDRNTGSGSLPAPKRKRGAQPNNKNAYKHGFYAKHFSLKENEALHESPLTSIPDVIDILRVSNFRFLEIYTKSLQGLDYKEQLAGIRALGLTGGAIASLTRIHLSAGANAMQAMQIIEEFKKIDVEINENEITDQSQE